MVYNAADSHTGYFPFVSEDGEEHSSFEVWAVNQNDVIEYGEDSIVLHPGYYWWACSPGCTPDGELSGPFPTSLEAWADARNL